MNPWDDRSGSLQSDEDTEEDFVRLDVSSSQDVLMEAIHAARETEDLGDATIVVKDNVLRAHSFLVSSFSTAMHDVFSKGPSQVLRAGTVDSEVMSCILDCMYDKPARIRESKLPEFLKASRELGIEALSTPQLQNLEKQLSAMRIQRCKSKLEGQEQDRLPVGSLPSSVTVQWKDDFPVDQTNSQVVSKNDGIKEKKEPQDGSNGHCCQCKKSSENVVTKISDEEYSEKQTLAAKLQKCGTSIRGPRYIPSLPSWLFTSSSVSLSPVRENDKLSVSTQNQISGRTQQDQHPSTPHPQTSCSNEPMLVAHYKSMPQSQHNGLRDTQQALQSSPQFQTNSQTPKGGVRQVEGANYLASVTPKIKASPLVLRPPGSSRQRSASQVKQAPVEGTSYLKSNLTQPQNVKHVAGLKKFCTDTNQILWHSPVVGRHGPPPPGAGKGTPTSFVGRGVLTPPAVGRGLPPHLPVRRSLQPPSTVRRGSQPPSIVRRGVPAPPTAGRGVPVPPTVGRGVPPPLTVGRGVPAPPTVGRGVPAPPTVGRGVPASPTVGRGVPPPLTVGRGVSPPPTVGRDVQLPPYVRRGGQAYPASRGRPRLNGRKKTITKGNRKVAQLSGPSVEIQPIPSQLATPGSKITDSMVGLALNHLSPDKLLSANGTEVLWDGEESLEVMDTGLYIQLEDVNAEILGPFLPSDNAANVESYLHGSLNSLDGSEQAASQHNDQLQVVAPGNTEFIWPVAEGSTNTLVKKPDFEGFSVAHEARRSNQEKQQQQFGDYATIVTSQPPYDDGEVQEPATTVTSQQLSVSGELLEPAITVTNQQTSVSGELLEPATTVTNQQTGVSGELQEPATTVISQQTSVSGELLEPATTVTSQQTSVSGELLEPGTTVTSQQTSVSGELLKPGQDTQPSPAEAAQQTSKGKKKVTAHKTFRCSVCHMAFPMRSALVMHLRRHSGQEYHHCSSCNFYHSSLKSLTTHTLRRHSRHPHMAEKKRVKAPVVDPLEALRPAKKARKEGPEDEIRHLRERKTVQRLTWKKPKEVQGEEAQNEEHQEEETQVEEALKEKNTGEETA